MGLWQRCYTWDVDGDAFLNRFVPASPLHGLPVWMSRWLGYRREKKQDCGNVLGAVWALVGAFCGLAVVAGVFEHTASIRAHRPPALIASFGASAVLEYNAIRSPLGQPRNALLGHTFSALIGVGVSKLFQYHEDYESVKWTAGATACGIASAIMLLTGTVHPPGGASAVLAATEPAVTAMGWYFVGLVMWGTTLMLGVGLVVNNVQRQFPMYWWTPMDVGKAKVRDTETVPDGQGGVEEKKSEEKQYDLNRERERVEISAVQVVLPADLSLNEEEARVLERLRERLRKRVDAGTESGEGRRSESIRSSTDFTVVPSNSSRASV